MTSAAVLQRTQFIYCVSPSSVDSMLSQMSLLVCQSGVSKSSYIELCIWVRGVKVIWSLVPFSLEELDSPLVENNYALSSSSPMYSILCRPFQCTRCCSSCLYFCVDWALTRLLTLCCTFELEGPKCFGLLCRLALENLTLASGGAHGFSNSSATYTILCLPLKCTR